MARRARMLALLQLSTLVFLLVAELTHAAPVSDGINTIHDDGDGVFSEKHTEFGHSEDKSGESEAEADHQAITAQDVNSVLKEGLDVSEYSEVTKPVDYGSSVQENGDKDSLSFKSDVNTGAAEDSPAVSEENVDNHEDSPVTKSGENGETTESSNAAFEENAGKHEYHTSVGNEEVTSARGTNDAVSEEQVERNEDPVTTKSGEDTSDSESKETVENVDGSITGTTRKDTSTPEDSEESLEENSSRHEAEAVEGEPSKEQIVTAVAGDASSEDSEEFADASKDNKAEKESVESSSDKGEDAGAEKTALNRDGASEDEVSEETSDAENEAEDIEVNENHSSTHEESHVTSSPFGRLSLPSSDNFHIERDEHHNDKDTAMDEHERNPSAEETAENEAGSPDELIENDRVDSQVINDSKTAALGKNMPITKDDKDAQNKDENLQHTSKESEMDSKTLEEENEKDNLLDKDDMDSKAHFAHSAERNEDVLVVTEETFNFVHTTENPSEDEGSGNAPDVVGLTSHDDNAHKDTSETNSSDRKQENKDEDVVVSEKEDTKLSKESGHTDGFGDFGSGQDEEEYGAFGKQANNTMDDVEDGAGSGSHALSGHYDMTSEEHTTRSNAYSDVSHVPIMGDDESSAEYPSESPAPENESSTKIAIFEQTYDQNESGDHFMEENLAQNNTNVLAMSMNPTAVPGETDHHVTFDGSGDDDDDATTPTAIIIPANIIDDNMAVSSREMDSVNSSVIGEASPAYQEKPAEKVVLPQLAAAPPPASTEAPCIEDEENDCLFKSNKTYENAGVTNILEDDDEVPPEATKDGIHTKSTSDDDLKEIEAVISTTPAVILSSEEESLQQSISVDLNKPLLHLSSTTLAPEVQDITEHVVDHETMDNETININAPDTIVEHSFDETGTEEMSGKIRAANVNEPGVYGKENSDDLGEPEALDSSSASGSYVVLGCIMAVVVVLLAYAAIKSRRERGTNTNSKKQNEVAGDDDDGTELKDMKKALLPPETPHDDCNGDIEANRKPLMDKDENQEEDEEKEPIIKQNGTCELSEPPRDIESQVDSSTAENQLKTTPTPNKPQQRNGLSEVVVEKPAISNGKADSIITHPVAAKVKVIENEDSIAKMPVIINRGGNSPPH